MRPRKQAKARGSHCKSREKFRESTSNAPRRGGQALSNGCHGDSTDTRASVWLLVMQLLRCVASTTLTMIQLLCCC
eukprot:3417888-Rhodomonas_salina.5